jgi:hypothetical protein
VVYGAVRNLMLGSEMKLDSVLSKTKYPQRSRKGSPSSLKMKSFSLHMGVQLDGERR